jgi:copper chaperone CopZ
MSVPTSVHELSAPSHVTIDIVGMTCVSCVRRVEKALSRVEGVQIAEVNLATETATVAIDPAVVTLDHRTAVPCSLCRARRSGPTSTCTPHALGPACTGCGASSGRPTER